MLKENVGLGLKYVPTGNEMMGRSDHYNFFKTGVNLCGYNRRFAPDYHTVRDNPDKLDCDKASRIATLFTGQPGLSQVRAGATRLNRSNNE